MSTGLASVQQTEDTILIHDVTNACVYIYPFDALWCHMGIATKHSVVDRVKPSFVIFDIRALYPYGYSGYQWDIANFTTVYNCQSTTNSDC